MKQFQVLTDSTADVVLEDREKNGLDYVPMVFTVDGKTYPASLDWDQITPEQYYGLMRNGKRSITGLIQTASIEEKIEKYFAEGLDILYVACSSKLSGSCQVAKLAADDFTAKYPDRKFVVVDSLRSNYGEGLIAIKAAQMANEGASIEETAKFVEENRLNYQTYATVGSLEWLKKAGRVKAGAAFFGNLLGVKPIILGDAIGNNYAFKKVKGRKTALDELIAITCERVVDADKQTIYVEHADCAKDAEYIAKQLEEKLHPMSVHISSVGPIIGATTGPDTITVNFYGQKVEIVGEE